MTLATLCGWLAIGLLVIVALLLVSAWWKWRYSGREKPESWFD